MNTFFLQVAQQPCLSHSLNTCWNMNGHWHSTWAMEWPPATEVPSSMTRKNHIMYAVISWWTGANTEDDILSLLSLGQARCIDIQQMYVA